MGNLVIPEKASEKEKIKSEMAGYLNELNFSGEISYGTYCSVFDFSMGLLDKMFEHGKAQNGI